MNSQSTKQFTQRDLILAKREGFHEGAAARDNDSLLRGHYVITQAANRRFPLEETRPRVVKVQGEDVWVRFKDGQVQYNTVAATGYDSDWKCAETQGGLRINAARAKAVADVTASPTENVIL
jgi:hypothetical protein